MFTVTTPAAERGLLTLAQLRAAVDAADTSQDGVLQLLGDRVGALIARHCRVPGDGIHPPTLRRERLQQTFRHSGGAGPSGWAPAHGFRHTLILARRFVSAIVTVQEAGVVLDPANYELHPASGLVDRLTNDVLAYWSCGRITVTFEAGFDTVPDDLQLAASLLARALWSSRSRDPRLRREEVYNVLTQEFFASDSALPEEVCSLLESYTHWSA